MSATAATTGFASPLASLFGLPGTLQPVGHVRYWPCELLHAFTLQMAAKGCPVNASMMLGSRDYAVEKLTHARSFHDDMLDQLAVQMSSYFDDEPSHAVAGLVAGSLTH
ncbi:MAG: hypothetical protein Q7T87_16360 [Polaromonas sp.]|nr:hypothetical protein [Polaromonas sp.]